MRPTALVAAVRWRPPRICFIGVHSAVLYCVLLVGACPAFGLNCGVNLMYCSATRSCISTSLLCNNRNDCPSGEDESTKYCHPSCPSSYFACGIEQCISNRFVCEGPDFRDCADGRDEATELCAISTDSPTTTKAPTSGSVSSTSLEASTSTSYSTTSDVATSGSTAIGGLSSSLLTAANSSDGHHAITTIATASPNGTNDSGSIATTSPNLDPIYCAAETLIVSGRRNVTLPREQVGKVIVLPCFSTGRLLLNATCQRTNESTAASYSFDKYNVSCPDNASESTQRLEDLSFDPITDNNAVNVMKELVNLTRSDAHLEPADIAYAARILDKLTLYYNNSNSTEALAQVSPLAASIISNLMDADAAAVESARKGDAVVSRIIANFDDILLKLAEALTQGENFLRTEETLVFTSTNVAYQITSGRTVAGLGLCRLLNATSVTKTITYDSMEMDDCAEGSLATIKLSQAAIGMPRSYALYNSAKLFGRGTAPGAFVLSSQISRKAQSTLSSSSHELVTFTQKVNKTAIDGGLEYACGYWVFERNSWETAGCISQPIENSSSVVCSCNHLTNFAVLMVPASLSRGSVHSTILGYLSIVCLSISSFALVFVIVTVLFNKQLRQSDAPRLTACLSASLLCLNILFIFGIDGADEEDSCVAVAAALHYFLLTSFMFMTAEALLYYLKLVKVLGAHVSYFIWKVAALSLGIPAIVVIAIRLGDASLYGKGQRLPEEGGGGGVDNGGELCWVQQTLQIYGVIIPVGVVVLVNSVVFILIVRALKCGRRIRSSMTDQRLERLHAKALAAVFVVLGITWLFGLLAFVEETSIVFQYLFCISNSLQGLLIFVFHIMKTPFIVNCLKFIAPSKRSSATTSGSDENQRRKSAMSLSTSVVTGHTTSGHSASRFSIVTPTSQTVQLSSKGHGGDFV